MPRCFGLLLVPVAGLSLIAAVAVGAPSENAAGDLDGFRTRMEKWVETRQLISAERSDWDAERETLQATRDLLAQQKQALEKEIAELEETSTAADDERRELLLARGEHQRASRVLEERIRSLEERVLALAARLPEPLREKLDVLLVQIPADPEATRIALGQRLVSVLGVLAQADKFNGTATLVAETRPVDDQKVQVRTLYWGLGQAVYVDAQGRTAGVGRPGAEGWEFSVDPALAGEARLLLDIHEGTVDRIEFVKLPVELR